MVNAFPPKGETSSYPLRMSSSELAPSQMRPPSKSLFLWQRQRQNLQSHIWGSEICYFHSLRWWGVQQPALAFPIQSLLSWPWLTTLTTVKVKLAALLHRMKNPFILEHQKTSGDRRGKPVALPVFAAHTQVTFYSSLTNHLTPSVLWSLSTQCSLPDTLLSGSKIPCSSKTRFGIHLTCMSVMFASVLSFSALWYCWSERGVRCRP